MQRTAPGCHVSCLRSGRAIPPRSLILFSLGDLHASPVKTLRNPSYLLPGERLQQALRRARPRLFAIFAFPLAAYVWQGFQRGHWGWGLVGVAIASGFGYTLWHSLVTGYTRINLGEFPRASRPLGYWLSIGFLFVGYCFGLAGLLLADYPAHR
jgi:hypothetical protein